MQDTTLLPTYAIVTVEQLRSLGIDLPQPHMQALLDYIGERTGGLIGQEVVESLDDEQAIELARLQESAPQNVEQWLQQHVPDITQIVEDNVTIVLGEVVENLQAIVASLTKTTPEA